MAARTHCPECKEPLDVPKERLMPDRVIEYRCAACSYQIPLLAPGAQLEESCPECGASPTPAEASPGVDSSGLLNFIFCGSCGCLLGRYWGMMGPSGL